MSVYSAEPKSAVLTMDSMEVGRMTLGRPDSFDHHHPPPPNNTGQQVEIELGHSYVMDCIVVGGNPLPQVTVSRSSGHHHQVPYHDVTVMHKTARDTSHSMTEPKHTLNASLHWTPTVDDIGQTFTCSAGVEMPRAVWASFIPIVTDSKTHRVFAFFEFRTANVTNLRNRTTLFCG